MIHRAERHLSATRPITPLTSIRGIAAWWVVVYHFREALPGGVPTAFVAFASQGYLAVDLFFVLSGFVIAFNYFDDFQEFRFSKYISFLGLRISRIYPLHFTMLLLFLSIPLAIVTFSA